MNLETFRNELDKELTTITDDFNSKLQKNTEILIKKICDQIDMIEKEFDKLD